MKIKLALLLSAAVGAAVAASAATIIKETTGTDLAVAGSWVGGAVPASGDIATWGTPSTASLGGNLTLGVDQSWAGIRIQNATGAVSLSGAGVLTVGASGITLDAAGQNLTIANAVVAGASQLWDIGTNRTLLLGSTGTLTLGTGTTTTLGGAGTVELGNTRGLAGDGALVINGATLFNNLQAGAPNSRTGATTLNSGVIKISTSINLFGTGAINLNGGAIGSGSTTGRDLGAGNAVNIGGNIAIGTGTGLSTGYIRFGGATNLGGAERTITSGATGILTGSGAGAIFSGVLANGGLIKDGTGILTLANDSNTFTGAVTVNAGNLAFTSGALDTASSVTLNGTAQLSTGSNGTTANANHVINNLSGAAGATIRSDFTVNGGTNTARTLTVNQTVDGLYAGTFVQGTGRVIGLVKEGAAKLTLGGSSGYTGGTTVTAGTLTAGSLTAFGSGAVAVNGGTLDLGGFAVTNAITLGGGTLANNSGTAVSRSQSVALGSDSALGGSGNLTLDGAITGAFYLTKVGGGTVTLNNAANAASRVIVTDGTLAIGNGTALGSGAVSVTGGALNLGGFGVANAIAVGAAGKLIGASNQSLTNVTFADGAALTGSFGAFDAGTAAAKVYHVTGGATFAALSGQGTFTGGLVTVSGAYTPGNSPGTQSFDSGLTLNGATTLEIGGDGIADLIQVTAGGLTLGAGSSLILADYGANYTDAFWDTNHTFSLISANAVSGDFATITNNLGGAGEGTWGIGWNGGDFEARWTATAIPEPSTYGLLGAGALAVVAGVRRRRKTTGAPR